MEDTHQLQEQNTEVVVSLKILEIIIAIDLKTIIGDLLQHQVAKEQKNLIQLVIVLQVLILQKSPVSFILVIQPQMGQPSFISSRGFLAHVLATTVMMGREEIMVGDG